MAASAPDVGAGVADVVLCHHALEPALARWAELVELRRILKPGGRLVLWLPLDTWQRSSRIGRCSTAPMSEGSSAANATLAWSM